MSSDLTATHRRSGGLVLPDGLERQLDAFRRTLWTIKTIEGVCGAVFGVLVAWLALFLFDRLGDTSAAPRWVLFAAAGGSCSVIPIVFHRWIWGRRGLDSLARLIARRFPSLGDQLLGIVEIVGNRGEQERSRSLCEAAIRQVAASAGRHDLREAVPRPRHRLWAWLAAVPLVLAVVLSVSVPEAAANAWARLLAPWRLVERFTFTTLDKPPESLVIPRGERTEFDVGLRADSRWRPAQARAWIGGGRLLTADRDGDHYRLSLPPQVADTALSLAVGDARHTVTISPMFRPELSSITALVRLPAYLGREEPVTKDARAGVLAVVKGSSAVVTATANRDLAAATVDGTTVVPAGDAFTTPAVVVEGPLDMSLQWQDIHGLSGGRPLTVSLVARDDDPPSIAVDGLPVKAVLLESETVRFALRARDDFGVKQVGIEWSGSGADAATNPARGARLLAAGGPTAASLDAVGTFSPAALSIAPQTVEVRAFAEDYLPGRGRVYSTPTVFLVMTSSDHALWINDQIARWKQQTAEVRDRELELLARNERLRDVSAEQLDTPASRKAIREQAAAERSNGRRLGRLAASGAELVGQALRNPEFDADTLEQLAENVQELEAMAETRIPGIGELLQAAAEASIRDPGTPPQTQEVPQIVGERRGAGQSPPAGGRPAAGGQKDDSPLPPTPQVVDTETAFSSADERIAERQADGLDEHDGGASGGAGPLRLPTTTVGSVPQKAGAGSPAARSQKKILDEAIGKQRRLIEDFGRIARQLTDVMARLEGTTFVKRLKAAARSELKVGERLASVVTSGFGRPERGASDDPGLVPFRSAAEGNDEVAKRLSAVMDDLDAFGERRPLPAVRTVLEEMKELDVLGSLRQLTDDMKREAGLSIAQTEFWSDTLDRWADELVPSPQEGGAGAGDGPPSESLPPELVLEAMMILEGETNLREETRVVEQLRPVLDAESFEARAEGLAAEQKGLVERVGALVEQLGMADRAIRFDDEIERMKREILPDTRGKMKFAREIQVFERVRIAMEEARGMLADADTGRPAIAAETEAIELLLQSQRGGGAGDGGRGGGSPGGGGHGDTGNAALALLSEGVNRRARGEPPENEQAIGRSGVELPEEFRHGLDAYFNTFERIRDAEGGTR